MRARSILPWRVLLGMPYGTYTAATPEGGAPEDPAGAIDVFRHLVTHGDSVWLRPWPLAYKLPSELGGKPNETSVIDLAGGAEAALAGMEGVTRRMAGQAERRGIVCESASGPAAVAEYYAMLEAAARGWGLLEPTISRALLEAVVDAGKQDVEIWFARYEGQSVAGGVVLYGAQELFFWSAAMRSEFATLRPSNALNVALIKAAAARGVRWYNLGSSEGLSGVKRFKEGLGATEVRYYSVGRDKPLYRAYSRLRGSRR